MYTICSVESKARGLWAGGLDVAQPVLGNECVHWARAGGEGHGAGAGGGSGGETLVSKAVDHGCSLCC